MQKIFRVIMALAMATSLVNVANAAITDGKYGEAQVYDVFRSGCNGGSTCNIYNFSAPYLGSWMSGTRVSWAAGDYISFVNVSGTNYSLVQYDSAGNQKAVVQTGGTITALGDGIVYIGQQGSTGYFFSNSQGIANPSQYTSSNPYAPQNMDYTVTSADLSSYAATSTVLTAGQTASSVSTPTYTAITSANVLQVTPTSTNSPAGEGATNVIDNDSTTKYLNFDRASAGFTIKLDQGRVLEQMTITTANDYAPRDPSKFSLFGSNDGKTWTTIVSNQAISLSDNRYTTSSIITFTNTNAYVYYFITFDSTKALDQYPDVASCVAGYGGGWLGNENCNSVQVSEVKYYYNSTSTVTSTDTGDGTIANPGTAGATSSLNPSPTVVSTNTTNQVSSSSSNGASTTTSSTSYGTPTNTDVVTYGTPVITVAVVNNRGEQTTKTLQIDQVTTTTVQTPVTTTTTTVTPYTTTTTTTTPVTTTTTTTPVTVTTYSDGTTTTTNGTPVVTTSTSNSVSSSQVSGTTTTVSANTITDTQVSSVTSPYFTRIDQFSMLNQNNRIQNLQLISDPLSLHRIVNGEIRLTYANVNERTTLTVHGSQGQSNTVDGYTSKIGSYGLSLDRKISDSLLLGGTLLQTYQSLSGNNSTGRLDREVVNLYSLYVKNDWLLKADIGYARGRFATSHSLPELLLTNQANSTGSDRWGQLRLYTPNLAGFRLLAGARIESNGIAATTDTGSELSAIIYPKYSVTNKTTEYGIRKDHYFNDRFSGYVEATKNNQDVAIYKGGLNYAVSNRVLIQANTSTIQFNENKITNYGIAARILF
jgi:hypothetical protein